MSESNHLPPAGTLARDVADSPVESDHSPNDQAEPEAIEVGAGRPKPGPVESLNGNVHRQSKVRFSSLFHWMRGEVA